VLRLPPLRGKDGMGGTRWQTGSWSLSLAPPSESNQREGGPGSPPLRGVPALLGKFGGLRNSRTGVGYDADGAGTLDEYADACEAHTVLDRNPDLTCDCSAALKGLRLSYNLVFPWPALHLLKYQLQPVLLLKIYKKAPL
jgi:hypothetical protein